MLGVFIIGWLLGGGYLLLRSMGKQPLNPAAKLPRCVGAALLAGLAGAFSGGVLYMLLAAIGKGLGVNLGALGTIVAVAAMIAVGYLVIYAMFNLPFGNVLRAAGPAIFGTILLAVVIGAAAAIPARYATQARRRREMAIHRLQRIHRAILMYEIKTGRSPKTLSALTEEHYIDASALRHPCAPQSAVGYFYLPARSVPYMEQTKAVRVCELVPSGDGRLLLFANGRCRWYSSREAQRILDLPENAAFASALAAARAN